jgi:hypothetical protein
MCTLAVVAEKVEEEEAAGICCHEGSSPRVVKSVHRCKS